MSSRSRSRSRSRATCRCPYSSENILNYFDVYVQTTLCLLSLVVTIIIGTLIYIFKVLYDRSLLVSPLPNSRYLNQPQPMTENKHILNRHEELAKKENRPKDRKISFITETKTGRGRGSSEEMFINDDDNFDDETNDESLYMLSSPESQSNVTMNEQFLKNIGYTNQSKGTMKIPTTSTLIKRPPVRSLTTQFSRPGANTRLRKIFKLMGYHTRKLHHSFGCASASQSSDTDASTTPHS